VKELRFAVVIFGYRRQNLRLLPWRYMHEINKHLLRLGHEVVVITDGRPKLPRNEDVESVPVIRLRHVKHFPPCNFDEIAKTITEVSPDAVLWLMGLTSFLQKRLYGNLGYPIVAVVGSPVYSLCELLKNLSVIDIIQNVRIIMANFAEAFIPKYLVRDAFNLDAINVVVTMSRRNKERLEKIGVRPDKLVCVPPSVDYSFLQRPSFEDVGKTKAEVCDGIGDCFLATYLGPPLNVRGLDTLLLAVKLAFKKSSISSRFRVLILSREQGEEHHAHRERLLSLVNKLGLGKVVKIKHGFLSKDEVKVHLAASDLVVLPFKHVISDVPISIMEGMSLGAPVLSTDLDGIPELLCEGRGLVIKPGDFRSLAELIAYYCENTEELKKYGERARKYMVNHSTWEDCARKMLTLLKNARS